MKTFKTNLLVVAFYLVSLPMLIMNTAGIKMGLEHLVHPTIALAVAILYMAFLGRYRIRYGVVPAGIGLLVDVGIWKTLIYFAAPQLIFAVISFGIIRYGYSYIVGSRSRFEPDFDLHTVSKTIRRFHPGAAQDAKDAGDLLIRKKA